MNRILLGTILLLTAGLCDLPAQATPTYKVGADTIVSPANKAVYTAYPPSNVAVPFSVTNQWVDVSWGTPSTNISIGWSMTDLVTVSADPVGLISKKWLANDVTNGAISVLTNSAGSFHRGVGNYTSESVSGSLWLNGGVSGLLITTTTLMDANGNTQGGSPKTSQVTFSTDTAI